MVLTCPSLKSTVALDTSEKLSKVLINNILPAFSREVGKMWMFLNSNQGGPGKIQGIIYSLHKGLNNLLFPAYLLNCREVREVRVKEEEQQQQQKVLKTELCFHFELWQSLYLLLSSKTITTGHWKIIDDFLFAIWTASS